MKKYTPSVKINNEIKDNAVNKIKGLTYQLQRRKYNAALEDVFIDEIAMQISQSTERLEKAICIGNVDVGLLSEKLLESISAFSTSLKQPLHNRVEEAADDVIFYLNYLSDVFDGLTSTDDVDGKNAEKNGWTKRRLEARLAELKEIKTEFVNSQNRVEAKLSGIDKDLDELDRRMLNEDNERSLNDIYRQINATKSKQDTLTVMKNNYSACFNTLDIIYENAEEMLLSASFDPEKLGKVKALLNINKLRSVMSTPDKAYSILKQMSKELEEVSANTERIDTKLSALNGDHTIISQEALKYKEELMHKVREKQMNEQQTTIDVKKSIDNKKETGSDVH